MSDFEEVRYSIPDDPAARQAYCEDLLLISISQALHECVDRLRDKPRVETFARLRKCVMPRLSLAALSRMFCELGYSLRVDVEPINEANDQERRNDVEKRS